MKSPYISRIKIKNFRNFEYFDVYLGHKQIIIGENNIGKTNLLRALQLILDPRLADEDRQLNESDFFNGITDPMVNKEEIEIAIEIQGFENNKALLSVLSDATVSLSPPTLGITYNYAPIEKEDTSAIEYVFNIYQGKDKTIPFTHRQRKYFNMRVISALRDVENEFKNSKKSPILSLLNEYDIDKEELKTITSNLKSQSNDLLTMDEIQDLIFNINSKFNKIIGIQPDSELHLDTMDFDTNRILTTLKLMIGHNKRPTNETSMGLTNILYISLVLLSLEDKTIPTFLKASQYQDLLLRDESSIIQQCYEETYKGNFTLKSKNNIKDQEYTDLYKFMEDSNINLSGFTLLALEEPEAHLHPILQRIIYKDVMQGDTSVLLTTHSPHISSVAPLDSIVHLRWTKNGTKVRTTSNIQLNVGEKEDIQRYLDVKRGELYFGKGVILVEGIAEEYLIPKFAELLEKPLDLKGIIVCNINSTNFTPYIKYLDALEVPYVCITDGDYYIEVPNDKKNDGSTVREYNTIKNCSDPKHSNHGYLGAEIVQNILYELKKIVPTSVPSAWNDKIPFFSNHGFYLGTHTLETEIMLLSNSLGDQEAEDVICSAFDEITLGGQKQKDNFRTNLNSGKVDACLRQIENSDNKVGKGRFAQKLSSKCIKNNIPTYIETAINKIHEKVDE